jgi:hypothetical protein
MSLPPAIDDFSSEDDLFSMEGDIAAETHLQVLWVASEEDCLPMEKRHSSCL